MCLNTEHWEKGGGVSIEKMRQQKKEKGRAMRRENDRVKREKYWNYCLMCALISSAGRGGRCK